MTLTAESFTGEGGELPQDLLGPDVDMEEYVDAILTEITATVTAAGTTDESLIRHGVLARVYRAAVAYYAKRPTSAQLADQGGLTWSNPASIYADLAKQEQQLYDMGLAAVGPAAIAATYPAGSVPTVILP